MRITLSFERIIRVTLNTVYGGPESCMEMLNKYGTYNIQPTAEADNLYPAIAHGLPKEKTKQKTCKKRKK